MTVEEALDAVLAEAAGERVHWTVLWDRALRGGLIDPLADRDARSAFMRALSARAAAGAVEKVAPGTYLVPPAPG
ncbi:MAG TPA: hypothetical protein VGB83_01200 [Actinomycetota bacterium]